MKKRIIVMALIIAAVHFVLMIGSITFAYAVWTNEFDNPDCQPSGVEFVANRLADILVQPMLSLWTPWMSKNMPNTVEWAICVVNSLLWGFVIALIINRLVFLKRKETIVKTSGSPPARG